MSYIFNIGGGTFSAVILYWWSDTLGNAAYSSYAVTGAEGWVNVNRVYNVTRGISCDWLVGLALYFSSSSKEDVSKIYGIWIPIWAFVTLDYQHPIANYFLIAIGIFYGTNFAVGKFIWASYIPVTLGNIIGGACFAGVCVWILYRREETLAEETGQPSSGENDLLRISDHCTITVIPQVFEPKEGSNYESTLARECDW